MRTRIASRVCLVRLWLLISGHKFCGHKFYRPQRTGHPIYMCGGLFHRPKISTAIVSSVFRAYWVHDRKNEVIFCQKYLKNFEIVGLLAKIFRYPWLDSITTACIYSECQSFSLAVSRSYQFDLNEHLNKYCLAFSFIIIINNTRICFVLPIIIIMGLDWLHGRLC